MNSVLTVTRLTKIFDGRPPFTAVKGISFDLEEGEILGFLGPNGSGKTTTIQMLLGCLCPTSGSIVYFGQELSAHRSQVLQQVAFASTYTSLPSQLTVRENLSFFGRLYGFKSSETAKRTQPLLERFGILEKIHQPVRSLSAGQITRLMLVKAFFVEPRIVLLDEPTASLDPDIASDVCRFLLEQKERKSVSILFTSHKMAEILDLCDRVLFLKEGEIIANDTPRQLAKSVSDTRLRLTVQDGLKRTVALADREQFLYDVQHRSIEISLDENKVPSFLNALMQASVVYTNIQIEEPSLESYFLKMAERKK